MSNLERNKKVRDEKHPKNSGVAEENSAGYDLEVPKGCDPMAWRLAGVFIAMGEQWNHVIPQGRKLVHNLINSLVALTDNMDRSQATEELIEEMIKWFWEEEWLISKDPKYAMDDFLNGPRWREAQKTILRRRHNAEITEQILRENKNRGPVEVDEVDREKNPAKPKRHPLGRPRYADSIEIPEHIREMARRMKEEQIERGQGTAESDPE